MVTWICRPLVTVLGLLSPLCNAADLAPGVDRNAIFSPSLLNPAQRFEVRVGAFYHGIRTIELDTADANLEIVFPRLPIGSTEWWAIFVPRPHLGGFLNTSGRTSAAYAGGLWTFPIYDRFFAEFFFGGAIHNGLADGSATRAPLGCSFAFNFGSSLGYRINTMEPHGHLQSHVQWQFLGRDQLLSQRGYQQSGCQAWIFVLMARPKRFELLTPRFVVSFYSIL